MIIKLEFYIEQPVPAADLDDFSDIIRKAIDEKIGETDYMVQDISYNIELEIKDDGFY